MSVFSSKFFADIVIGRTMVGFVGLLSMIASAACAKEVSSSEGNEDIDIRQTASLDFVSAKTVFKPVKPGAVPINQSRGHNNESNSKSQKFSPLTVITAQPDPQLGIGGLVNAPVLDSALQILQANGQSSLNGLAPDDLANEILGTIRVENNLKSNVEKDIVSYGYVFSAGGLKIDDQLVAVNGGRFYQTQIDPKTFYADGSVKHGVVTMVTPDIKESGFVDMVLARRSLSGALTSGFSVDAKAVIENNYSLPLSISLAAPADQGGSENTVSQKQINVRDLLLNDFQQNWERGEASNPLWLNGNLVKEYRVESQAADHLQLRFDVRVYADGDISTDIIFANEKTYTPGLRDLTYSVKVGTGSNVVMAFDDVQHHRSATWRRRVWHGTPNQSHVVYNIERFVHTGAILPLDDSQGILAQTIDQFDKASLNLPPLSPSIITQYFPTTGGRAEIGIYPQWASNYLVSQSEVAKRAMLAIADAGGAVPWHFRDEKTNLPVSVEVRPKFWIDARGQEAQYAPDRMHPDVLQSGVGGWEADHPHKPSLFYVPYLITGDHYYADELAMQAAWALSGRWPALREGGLKVIDVEQVRGSAWSLRDLSDAAFILPDGNETGAYIERALVFNLALMKQKYVDERQRRDAGEVEGYFDEFIGNQPSRVSPWQQDYLMLALWVASHRGNEDARALLSWGENFHTSRFLSPDFDFKRGSSYIFAVRDGNTKTPYKDWTKVAEATYNNETLPENADMEGYPDSASSYLASALATQLALTHSIGALSAYETIGKILLQTQQNEIWSPTRPSSVFSENQYFFSLPSLSGEPLTRAVLKTDIAPNVISGVGVVKEKRRKGLLKKKRKKADKIDVDERNIAPSTNGIIYLGSKSELVMGSDGSDILYGFNTDKKIHGLAGDDLIFGSEDNNSIDGGVGDDIIMSSNGDDVLNGGPGRDVFAYLRRGSGRDVIEDFNPAEDKIGFSRFIAPDVKAIFARVKGSPEGVIIDLHEGQQIVLPNISVQELTPDHFKMVQ